MTEDEVLQVINNIANRLANRFKFGYHETEDMKQEARLLAISGIDKFDETKSYPLENFLWTHVRNRLFNLKRNNYERPDKPCFKCPFNAYDLTCASECSKYEDKFSCSLYKGWIERNTAKKNILQPIDLSTVDRDTEDNMKIYVEYEDNLDNKEIKRVLNKYLPLELRADYLKLINNVHVPKNRKLKVFKAVTKILEDYGHISNIGSTE